MRWYRHGPLVLVLLLVAAVRCGSAERPPNYDPGDDAGGKRNVEVKTGTGGSGNSSAPPEDLSGLCGNQILPIVQNRPNLYLVLDRSGSMRDPLTSKSDSKSKYEASVDAVHDVLFAIGHRVSYGAALFPAIVNSDSCGAGTTIDEVHEGDSVTYARNELDGPHLQRLMRLLKYYPPEGSTPTSATLEKVRPMLLQLTGDTAVILTTDGAPNCNGKATCSASQCIANIEGSRQQNGDLCGGSVNCCDKTGDYGPYACIDESATRAPLEQLRDHGIKTYVIGLPGTDAYVEVLNRLAESGGTARNSSIADEPKYYRVEDSAALAQALKSIVSELSISCTVELDEAPPDWSMVNVYFDNGIVPMNADNGWRSTTSRALELVGDSCKLLRSGDVMQVQVVAGCPTETML